MVGVIPDGGFGLLVLFQNEVPDHKQIHFGGKEAANGIFRRADEGFAADVEACIN
jgi:hypothetical protein